MRSESSDPTDDRLSAWLTAYDAALAAGESAPPPDPGDLARRSRACLDALETLWPRSPQGRTAASLDGNFGELQAEHSWKAPSRLGRFMVLRELGRGGCGIVFLAFDPELGRRVALKVPRAEALLTPDLRNRFLREAQTAASLDHPGIVSVYEAGELGGVCYIASAYCRGIDLASWLKQQTRPVPAETAASLIASLAQAATHAHQRGIVHRDLKPANILLSTKDEVPSTKEEKTNTSSAVVPPSSFVLSTSYFPKITDFGLAKLMEREMDETTTGVIIGTPPYMAPEQAESRTAEIGPATDIYALGAILYELLTGRPPFWADTALQTLEQVRTQEAIPPSKRRPGLPRALDVICEKCLQKEPGRRYASAAELADDLYRYIRHEPIQARAVSWWGRAAIWCRRPERIRDAGAAMILLSLILLGWCAACFATGVAGERWGELIPYVGILILLVYLPMLWIGVRTLARSIFAIWTGTLLTGAYSVAILFSAQICYQVGYELGGLVDPRSNQVIIMMNNFIFVFSAIVCGCYVLALVAYYSNRGTFGSRET